MRGRVLLGVAAMLAVVLLAFLVPMPGLERIREWSTELGAWFPLVFFLTYAVVSVFPVPRSTFTYSAAVLFVPAVAIPGALVATAAGATMAFLGVRALGYERAAGLRRHPRVVGIDAHLRRRGWPSIIGLSMVPAVPFSVLNYAAALSSIRFAHFLPARVVGSAPGTVAAILLGDALTEGAGTAALWATAAFAVIGLAGVWLDARIPVRPGGASDGWEGPGVVDDDEVRRAR